MKNNWELLFLVLTVVPTIIRIFAYVGLRSTNRKITILSERAMIIAKAMEQSNLEPSGKKSEAINRLLEFAKEVSINLSRQQAEDYIESSVNELHTNRTQ